MSAEALVTTSLILVGVAILFAALTAFYDWKATSVQAISVARHGTKGPLSRSTRWKIVVFLLYAAIAFASEIALEWLAAIALITFFSALVLDRVISAVMFKRGITPSDPAPQAEARQAAAADNEITPEPIGEMLLNIAGIVVTLVAWAAVISLIMLLCFTMVEVVIPHYVEVIRGLL